MVKRDSAGCTRKKRPRFFKVFFPGRSSTQLKHLQQLHSASTCLLSGPSRKVWRVGMIKNETGMFFQNGWEEFVRDHSLQTGEFLVFEYEGGLRFSVLVFDASMCEKESVIGAASSSQVLASSAEVEEEPSFSCAFSENDSTASAKRSKGGGGVRRSGRIPSWTGHVSREAGSESAKKKNRGVWMSQRRPVTKMEIKNAHQAACSFKSVNPFFVQVMQKYHVYNGYELRVAPSFSRKHLPDNKKMTFWDPTGKPWTINYIYCSGRYFFSGGWRKFSLANFLEQDDACIFELIGANEIRVHIFRVVEEIKPLVRKVGF